MQTSIAGSLVNNPCLSALWRFQHCVNKNPASLFTKWIFFCPIHSSRIIFYTTSFIINSNAVNVWCGEQTAWLFTNEVLLFKLLLLIFKCGMGIMAITAYIKASEERTKMWRDMGEKACCIVLAYAKPLCYEIL